MASTLASRIRDALEKREGANQSALAKACNVSRATVTDWLNGDIKELKADSLPSDRARAGRPHALDPPARLPVPASLGDRSQFPC